MNREYLLPKIFIFFFILLFFFKVTVWYDILLYLVYSIIAALIYEVLKLAVLGKYHLYLRKIGKPASRERIQSIAHGYMMLVNRLLRMEVIVHNYENFDPTKHYFITPNHQSNADAPLMLEVFKSPFLFVSKFSMSKVIIVKDWMNLLECLFLKKDDMRGQIIVMNEVADRLSKGKNVLIFPEGKRSFSKELNEFRPGTFKVAQKTQATILPVTSNDVYKMRHRYPWRKTIVNVYIHKPIPYEDYKDLGTNEIADMVQKMVESKIE